MLRLLMLLGLLVQVSFTSNALGQFVPQFEELARPETIIGDSVIIRLPRDERTVVASSTPIGDWKTYKAPAGTKVTSVFCSDQIGACVMRGDPVLQLAIFHVPSEKWTTYDLAMRDHMNEFCPFVCDFVACFVTTQAIIAYSGTKNRWSRLPVHGTPQLDDRGITVKTANATWFFDGKSGRWQLAEMNSP